MPTAEEIRARVKDQISEDKKPKLETKKPNADVKTTEPETKKTVVEKPQVVKLDPKKVIGEVHVKLFEDGRFEFAFSGNVKGFEIERVKAKIKKQYRLWQNTFIKKDKEKENDRRK